MRAARGFLLCVGALLISATSGAAQSIVPSRGVDRTYGFLLIVGTDTVGVERITVADGRWTGEIVVRGQGRAMWGGVRESAGHVSTLELTAFRSPGDSAPAQRVTLTVIGDSLRMRPVVPAGPDRMLATRADAFILLNTSFGMFDLLLERAGAGVDHTVPVLLANGGQTIDATIHRTVDSASVALAGQVTRIALDRDGRVREGRVVTQGLYFVRVEGDALSRVTIGAPNYDAPPNAPYTAEHVRVPTPAGHELAGTFTHPAGATRVPVVITISGSGPQDRDEALLGVNGYHPFRQIADTLGRNGIAVLRFDDRGYGASTVNAANATSADFADDVRALVAWVRARPDVDPDRVYLLGHSEGALIAPLVASTDVRIAGLALLAGPAQNGRDIILYQQRHMIDRDSTLKTAASRDSSATAARIQYDSLAVVRPWYRFFNTCDPLATARRVRSRVLILHGETDRQVTADQAPTLGAAFRDGGNSSVTVHVFPGLNHLFLPDPDGNPANYGRLATGRIGAEVLGMIVDWLRAR
jgi:dipeptidyl aminopeptidase/acylaminoacyl peptidase